MRKNLKQCVWIGAMSLSIAITGGMARVAASSSQEQHEQDYSRNKNYQRGLHDGQDDQRHNRDHFKTRHFKKDDDQKAYESGYQEGHRGDQRDHGRDQERHEDDEHR